MNNLTTKLETLSKCINMDCTNAVVSIYCIRVEGRPIIPTDEGYNINHGDEIEVVHDTIARDILLDITSDVEALRPSIISKAIEVLGEHRGLVDIDDFAPDNKDMKFSTKDNVFTIGLNDNVCCIDTVTLVVSDVIDGKLSTREYCGEYTSHDNIWTLADILTKVGLID